MAKPEKIAVENVNVPGQISNVDKIKYLAVKQALLEALPANAPGLTFQQTCEVIKPQLDELFPAGAKVGWWAKTVQLDLEAKAILARTKTKPLRWYRLTGVAS